MPAVTKHPANGTVRAWQGFAAVVEGEQHVVRGGALLAGSHPAVRAFPAFFLPHDASDREIAAARFAVEDEARERDEARKRAEAEADRSRLAKLLEAGEGILPRRSRDSDRRRAEQARAEAGDVSAAAERSRREKAEKAERDREVAALRARAQRAAR